MGTFCKEVSKVKTKETFPGFYTRLVPGFMHVGFPHAVKRDAFEFYSLLLCRDFALF